MNPDKPNITFTINPSAAIVNYIATKGELPHAEVEKKLANGEVFDIKGEGNDIDTKLMEEILNENDFYERPNQKLLKD